MGERPPLLALRERKKIAHHSRRRCTVCRRHVSEVGPISWSGKCGDCGRRIYLESADQMHGHGGDVFLQWRRRVAAGVGAILIDDLLPDE